MTRNDIIRMAHEALVVPFFLKETNDEAMVRLRDFAALVAAAERNKLAQWMIDRSYATGHGDTTEDLLQELEWQIAMNWTRGMVYGVQAEREACAQVAEDMLRFHTQAVTGVPQAIRARGQA